MIGSGDIGFGISSIDLQRTYRGFPHDPHRLLDGSLLIEHCLHSQ
jgi:hypothetical protein